MYVNTDCSIFVRAIHSKHYSAFHHFLPVLDTGFVLIVGSVLLFQAVNEVSNRLCALGKFDLAAERQLEHGTVRGTVDCLLKGNNFQKARAVASSQEPSLLNYIETKFQQHLLEQGKVCAVS